MTHFIPLLSMAWVLLIAPGGAAAAGFGIDATRLIYPEGASSIDVAVRNTLEHQPYLVQVAVSDKQGAKTSPPFIVTPPLFRLEPKSTNKLRIAFTGAPLPGDRESIFYFHATAIPASTQPDSARQNSNVSGQVRFGLGKIIKLFYRPGGLPSTAAEAQRGLQFSRVSGGLRVTNPSAYYVSLASLQFGEQKLKLDTPEALTIAPFGSHSYPTLQTQGQVSWQTINDIGGVDAFTHALP